MAAGFGVCATAGTARFLQAHGVDAEPVMKISEGSPNLVDLLRGGKVDVLINTLSRDKQIELEAAQIRRASVELGIPCLTSLDTANALLLALRSRRDSLPRCYSTKEFAPSIRIPGTPKPDSLRRLLVYQETFRGGPQGC